ncbi:hypothetical protein FRC12_014756 [Ceratobasidium sp. 428]|nr:hypothetical protein FRC12_014756 [Ceratobasidium sp. 428]
MSVDRTGIGIVCRGAFEIPPNAAIVDDSVVSIEWSGSGWQNAGDTGSAAYYQNSMHKTTNPGDSATFRFNGTAVWYFTDMINGNAPVLISIDGGQGEMVQTAPSGGAGGRTQKLAWSKTGLSDSQHTINIRHAGSAGSPAGVDFLMYMPGSGGGSNSGSPGSSGSNNGSNNTTTKSTPIGPIVGGVVGGVVLLALLAIFLVIRARDKREKREHDRQMEQAMTRPVRPAAESYTKEGWSSPPPPSALSYGSPSSGHSYGPSTSVMGGGSSGNTNFSARGYVGYPEVQQR